MTRRTLFVSVLAGLALSAWTIPIGAQAPVPQLPPTQAAEQSPKPAESAPEGYTVGPGDRLRVDVFGEGPPLSGTYRVESDGTILYYEIGRLPVVGLTERGVGDLITKRLSDGGYILKPNVTVQIEEFRSRFVFVLGEVGTPGMYALKGQNTLLEVLAMAGSVTNDASKEVKVIRPKSAEARARPNPDASADEADFIKIDLSALEQGRMVDNVRIEDGDTIFVSKAETYFVAGHVRSPNRYTWSKGITVEQAIIVAGGYTDRGSNRGIKIRREVKPGKFEEIGVNRNDPVLPGDTIIVRMRRL